MKRRFVVRTVTGYSEGSAGSGAAKESTSYMVLDSFYNYREVRSFYVTSNGPRDFARRLLAQEAADALEAKYG